MRSATTTRDIEDIRALRVEIRELRLELAEVRALLRTVIARRRSKRPPPPHPAVELSPEVRASIRTKMVRAAERRAAKELKRRR